MLKIGLTGGIGSGKSTVARIFELLDVPVYYADAASKRLYHTDPELKLHLKKNFGDDIYVNEELDRAKLSAIVFNDPVQLQLLNQLVHPPTIRDLEVWMKNQTAPYAIKEAALLFESGSEAGLDFIIGVQAPEALRISRVIKRDGLTKEEILSRASKQMDEEKKLQLCDFIIHNDEKELLIPQVLELHQKLLRLSDL